VGVVFFIYKVPTFMSASKLGNRYAKSLIDLAIERGTLADVYKDISSLKESLSNRDLFLFFKSPIINPSKKLNILKSLYEGKVNELTYGFYEIIVKKRREAYIPEIVDAFIEQYNVHQKISTAKVTTAVPINDTLIEKIKNIIKKNKKEVNEVVIETVIDESILGGFILKFDDKLYDYSIAGKLANLQKSFSDNKYVKKM